MSSYPFRIVFGRGLVEELHAFVHRPYVVVTMADLWPVFADRFDAGLAGVHLVESLEVANLELVSDALPACNAIVGLGGGQAIDVAKFFAWRRRLPLFQVPTAMSVNAPFGHRAGLRVNGIVRYLGWAVPEAVYVDFDIVASAPRRLNRAGIGDVLCYHTAHRDWRLAHEAGRTEPQWPYDEGLVAEAKLRLDGVLAALDDIRAVNEHGIRTLMLAHHWGGATFHDSGWNPRHIEGMEHFFFYNLERLTGRHFIHGQPVGLGCFIGATLQDDQPELVLDALLRAGVDVRPEAMGVNWDDAAEAMRTLASFSRQAGLWYTAIEERPIDDAFVAAIRERIVDAYTGWEGQT